MANKSEDIEALKLENIKLWEAIHALQKIVANLEDTVGTHQYHIDHPSGCECIYCTG